MARGRPPPGRRAERSLLRVRRARGSIGPQGDGLARRRARADLVVVCAEGGSSAYVAEILGGRGLAAANLAGGMVAWGLGTTVRPVVAERPGPRLAGAPLRTGVPLLRRGAGGGRRRGRPAPRARRLPRPARARAAPPPGGLRHPPPRRPRLGRTCRWRGTPESAYHASPRDFEGATIRVEGLTDGQPVRIGQLEVLPIVPLGTPGHTPGSTSLLVRRRPPPDRRYALRRRRRTAGPGRPGGRVGAGPPPDASRAAPSRSATPVVVLPAHAAARAPSARRRRRRHARRPPAPEPCDAARPRRVRPRGRARGRLGSRRVRAGSGRSTWAARRAAEAELTELELGKNQCALSRR